MKRCLVSLALLAVFGGLAFAPVSPQQAPTASAEERVPEDNVKTLMRRKLSHTQAILEGIATEDFELIGKSASALAGVSQAAQWQVFQTPDYVRLSGEFRRTCDDLTQQAKNKQLDAAALSYVKLTTQCVECHKYVRAVRLAGQPLESRTLAWAAFPR